MPKYEQTARRAQFYTSVLDDVRILPGVASAAYISFLPMVMRGGIWGIEAEGNPVGSGDASTASIRYVTPGFFATLGIPVRRGRDVSEADTEGALSAAVVSESFVARYWPGHDPVGRSSASSCATASSSAPWGSASASRWRSRRARDSRPSWPG
jgi:hypothetical protein